MQLHSGPASTDPAFGRGWYDGPFTSFIALGEEGTDERIELHSQHDLQGQKFNVSYSEWKEIVYGEKKYRIDIRTTEKTEAIWNEYLHPEAVMVEGNQFYLTGFEIQVCEVEERKWRTLCAYSGAKTSMKYNPKRIVGIVRWEDGELVDDEAKMLGMTVVMVVTEQA